MRQAAKVTKLNRVERNAWTKQKIFDAATKVVGEYGYAEASVARITEQAGVAQGTFYNHFENRQELLDQLLPKIGIDMVRFIRERTGDGHQPRRTSAVGGESRRRLPGEDCLATIMVVDDATFMRMKCAELLTGNGYDVIEADTGARALEAYEKHRPDAVLLDITMPDMDGLTALGEIMKIDPCARVAMVTALDQQSITMEALKRGARSVVVKPFNAERIMSTVMELVA